jgi:hypothetical protein
MLIQELFGIFEENYEVLERNECAVGEEIYEDPDSLHRIGNGSLRDWAVSIHEFTPGFKMKVYDFAENKKWLVDGNEDTLGDPRDDAGPIWPNQIEL